LYSTLEIAHFPTKHFFLVCFDVSQPCSHFTPAHNYWNLLFSLTNKFKAKIQIQSFVVAFVKVNDEQQKPQMRKKKKTPNKQVVYQRC